MSPHREPIHWRARLLSGGRVWTACGHVVEQEHATVDCADVTCEGKGCRQEADARFEQRRQFRTKTWEELTELRDIEGHCCGDE